MTISKNLTIDGGAGQVASVLTSNSNGIVVNGSGIVVTLKNLSINGTGSSGIAVDFTGNSAQLSIINCDIFGATAYDIGFFPQAAGVQMYVANTTVHNSSAYGIVIDPLFSSGNNALVTVDNVKAFMNGAVGLYAADNSRVQITHSDFSNNSAGGLDSISANTPAIISMDDSIVSNNGGPGLTASGSGTPRFRISNTMISANAGASISGAPNVFSFGNNRIVDNNPDVAPGNTIMQQ